MLAKLTRDEAGITLVLVALLLVALLGAAALAVDIGRLYLERQHLVNSCDAAALAGGIELPDQAVATTKAGQAAAANAMPTYQVSFPSTDKLRVDGQEVVQYGFARVLGYQEREVSAYAVVQRTPGVKSTSGVVVPWGIPYTAYQQGEEILLKVGSTGQSDPGDPEGTGGNFYPLALERSLGDGSSGGAVYTEDIRYGFQGEIEVGDVVSTEPGNMVGPTRQAVVTDADSLFHRAEQEPWASQTPETATYGNPRVVIVPIVTTLGSGRDEVTILGFAAFYITAATGQTVTGYFIEYTIPSGTPGGPDYGVSVLRLVE